MGGDAVLHTCNPESSTDADIALRFKPLTNRCRTGDPTHKARFWRALYLIYGAGAQTRTADLLITNQLLYQLSYTGVGRKYKAFR